MLVATSSELCIPVCTEALRVLVQRQSVGEREVEGREERSRPECTRARRREGTAEEFYYLFGGQFSRMNLTSRSIRHLFGL